MKGVILLVLYFFGFFFLNMKIVNAQYIPFRQAQPTSQLFVNKFVKNPATGQFVDNLDSGVFRFLARQEIIFRIDVKNTGEVEFTNISVRDKLPDFLDFLSGPGNFDRNSQTLNFTVDRLSPNETKTYEIKAKIKDAAQLPQNIMITCLTNFVEGRANQLFSQDTAVFCIENKVLGVAQELPRTGIRDAGLILFFSTLLLGASAYLYRKSFVKEGI